MSALQIERSSRRSPLWFNSETLKVTVHGKAIDELLRSSIDEGLTFFAGELTVRGRVEVL